MEITYCRYHPAQPATWHCSPCQRDFGDCCIPLNADAPELEPQCPLCAGKLQFLGAANTAQPFWQRIPLFFRYGLQPGPLLFAAALCLASLFMPAWKLLWLALFCVATKYLQSVIESSSQGVREAPALQGAFDGEGFSLFWRLLVIFFIAFAVVWLAADFDSEALFWAATLGVQLLIPASIIRLALDKTLSAALSPDQVGAVIKAMGWRYLILWVFLFILWQSPDAVVYMLSSGLPRVVLMPIAALLFGYFSVVMCAMMGYAVFQYQGALGYVAVDESAPRGVPAEEYRRRRALADAEVRVKEGQSAQALEVLAKALDVAPNDLKLNERFHQLLFGLGARERCLRHLEHYLPLAARLNPAQGAFALLNARQFKAGLSARGCAGLRTAGRGPAAAPQDPRRAEPVAQPAPALPGLPAYPARLPTGRPRLCRGPGAGGDGAEAAGLHPRPIPAIAAAGRSGQPRGDPAPPGGAGLIQRARCCCSRASWRVCSASG